MNCSFQSTVCTVCFVVPQQIAVVCYSWLHSIFLWLLACCCPKLQFSTINYIFLYGSDFHLSNVQLEGIGPVGHCCFLAIFVNNCCSMFAKQLLLFLTNLPSPLLSFVLPMMKLSKSIHYIKYELMIKNL